MNIIWLAICWDAYKQHKDGSLTDYDSLFEDFCNWMRTKYGIPVILVREVLEKTHQGAQIQQGA